MGTSQEKAKALLANGIGHISRLPSTTGLDPARCAELANHIQGFLVGQTRLGIPAIVH